MEVELLFAYPQQDSQREIESPEEAYKYAILSTQKAA